jgi:hypothetical protein
MYENIVNVNEQHTSAVINKYMAMIPISAKHEHEFLNRNNDTQLMVPAISCKRSSQSEINETCLSAVSVECAVRPHDELEPKGS